VDLKETHNRRLEKNCIMKSFIIRTCRQKLLEKACQRWDGQSMQHGQKRRYAYKVLVGNSDRRRPVGTPSLGRKDNIKIHLKSNGLGGCGLDSFASGLEPVAGSRENCNETSGSIKSCGFLAWLNNCSILKGSAP
jgi:hypothetical protein